MAIRATRVPALAVALSASLFAVPALAADPAPLLDPSGTGTVAAAAETPAEVSDRERAKGRAQSLLTQGIDRLQTFEYQAALDFFIGAYAEYQSPKILLNIGATLLELGRNADAANTFQLYIEDPETKVDRVAEVKSKLLGLDEQLVVARVAVEPSGTDVSIDGGPWVPVGQRLLTRLTPGIHMLRGRKEGHAMAEISINTFEGEARNIPLRLEVAVAVAPTGTDGGAAVVPPPASVEVAVQANPNAVLGAAPAEEVTAWLVTGAKAERGGVQTATVVDVTQFLPSESEDEDPYYNTITVSEPTRLGVGVQSRFDVTNSGFAIGGGVKIELSPRWQVEASMMFSKNPGFYVGARYRLLTGVFQPYLAAGEPFFVVDGVNPLRLGVRAGGGLEIRINDHFGVTGEIAYEHFFDISAPEAGDPIFLNDYFVPLVGVEGRL